MAQTLREQLGSDPDPELKLGVAKAFSRQAVAQLTGIVDHDTALVLLEAAVAESRATTVVDARCPDTRWDGMVGYSPSTQCAYRTGSEDDLYWHLRNVHLYPDEDAGSSAARAWNERN